MNELGDCLYLYCISDRQPPTEVATRIPYPIESLCSGKLVAIVGRVSQSDFGEENLKRNLNDLQWITTQVRRHEQVIEQLLPAFPLVPSKFASVFLCRENVTAFLTQNTDMLLEKLQYFRQRQEWGIKIYCDLAGLQQHALMEDRTLLEFDRQIGAASVGKAYLLRKKKEEVIGNVVEEKLNSYRQSFFSLLDAFGIRSKINALLSPELTARDDRMVLNAAFLLETAKVPSFIKQVETLTTEFGPAGFDFDCTGPWPPYNFC